MSGEFIDSNVFVYLFDETDDRRCETAERIVDSALQTHNASICELRSLNCELGSGRSRGASGQF